MRSKMDDDDETEMVPLATSNEKDKFNYTSIQNIDDCLLDKDSPQTC